MIIVFVRGLVRMVISNRHLINSLLRLEFIAISVFILLNIVFTILRGDYFIIFYYLVIIVCEGVLGLSLLVILCHNYRRDLIESLNLVRC